MKSITLINSSLTLILLVITLTGCTNQNYKPVNLSYLNSSNITNSSITTIVPEMRLYNNGTNIFFFKSNSNCELIYLPQNITYLIDCGGSNYLEIMGKIKRLGIDHIDNFIATSPTYDNMNLDKMLLRFKPDMIYDTGIPNSFSSYRDLNITNVTIISKNISIDGIYMTPTYSDGFLTSIEANMIVVSTKDAVFINGCYGNCEERFTGKNFKVMFLGNAGQCPTNSPKFLIQINPDVVIGRSTICGVSGCGNVCNTIQDYITAMDIQYYDQASRDIQLVDGAVV